MRDRNGNNISKIRINSNLESSIKLLLQDKISHQHRGHNNHAISFINFLPSLRKIIVEFSNFLFFGNKKKSLGFPLKKRNWIEISPWKFIYATAFELHFTLLRYRYWTPLFHDATSFYSSPPLITWSLMIFRATVTGLHFRAVITSR